MCSNPKIIRACTVSDSINFVAGIIPDLLKEYELGVLASPGPHWHVLDRYADSVKQFKIPMTRHISPVRDLRSLWQLVRVFRRERPDMVHSMTPKAGLLCMIASWMCRVPCRVHTFTGLVFPTSTGLKRKILMATDWLTCACATHIVPEGEGVKRDLLKNGITRKPIKVLGYGNCHGIDLARFDRTPEVIAEAAKLCDSSAFTFIACGRVVSDKGINELVAAFKRLNQEIPATRLLLLGYYEAELDPLKAETEKEITDNPYIIVTGMQTDVRPWYAAAQCAVLASYREGFPNVVIEAGAMGLPQIVTDINGANEIIVEGKNGTIIPPKDTDALYSAMKRMVIDSTWRKSLAMNARAMIASRYDREFVKRCLLDYYKEIL